MLWQILSLEITIASRTLSLRPSCAEQTLEVYVQGAQLTLPSLSPEPTERWRRLTIFLRKAKYQGQGGSGPPGIVVHSA
jgi:hypothetical protein